MYAWSSNMCRVRALVFACCVYACCGQNLKRTRVPRRGGSYEESHNSNGFIPARGKLKSQALLLLAFSTGPLTGRKSCVECHNRAAEQKASPKLQIPNLHLCRPDVARRCTWRSTMLDEPSNTASGRVSVSLTTKLAVPRKQACNAWLDYVWACGGGLPFVGTMTTDNGRARTLLPLLLKEKLCDSADDKPINEEVNEIAYTVTDAGPILGVDVIAGSHKGLVKFSPSATGDTTTMVWNVDFDTRARSWLWEAVTRTTVGDVSANLEARLRAPAVFTLTACLACTPDQAIDTWLQCLADGDLGVPMPPPIVLAKGDDSWAGYERLIVPPGLRERVVVVERSRMMSRCEYTIVNPSWFNLYPVHSHYGTVDFMPSSDGMATVMTWKVSVRPLRGGGPTVRFLTSIIVPAFSRNLASRLGEADAANVSFSWA